ncbi:MAG: stage III sporulation protein AA, partial [Candidatus Saccharibacteria bacterium]
GMIMAVRALAPDIVVTDEIGRLEDAEAIRECLNAGVKVFASAHGASLEEVSNRPALHSVFQQNSFQIAIVLSRRRGPATIEQIIKLDQVRRQSH